MKKLIICALCSLSIHICFSQATLSQASKFDPAKLEFGGNFGLSFGNNTTSVVIAPQTGYAYDPRFSAGVGVNYSYYRYSTSTYNSTKLNYMWFNVYGRIRPVQSIVLQVQPEFYRMWGTSNGLSISQPVTTLLVGGGVTVPLGNRGGILLMLYYDLVQNDYSPYGDRLFYSVGYTFAL